MASFTKVLILSLVVTKAYKRQEEFEFDFPGESHNNCLDVVGLVPPPGTVLDHGAFNITVQFSAHTKFEDSAFDGIRAFLTTSYVDYSPRIKPKSVFYPETSKEFVTFVFNETIERRKLFRSVNRTTVKH